MRRGLALAAFLSLGVSAAGAAGGTADNTAFSESGLDAIQRTLETAVAERRIPAAIATLAVDGTVVWTGTAGTMTAGIPMRSDAILPLASVGKLFTATAAMILLERGELSLDDPVSRYIPEFANVRVATGQQDGSPGLIEAESPITVAHLLTHTSGLTVTGDEFWALWDKHVARTTTTAFARDLAGLPLHAQPGAAFRYGQTGAAYEVLGAVIEIVSGQTLEEFMQQNIFEPLALEDSSFYLPADKAERLPEVYRRVNGELVLDREYGEDFSRSTFFHGGGGVRSSAADLQRFARLFLDGGQVDGVRLLEAETVQMMMSDQLGDLAPQRWQERERTWGFGAAIQYHREGSRPAALQRFGWVGGGFAKLWIDPEHRLVAYLNFPLTPPGDNDLLAEFEDLVYAAIEQSR